METVTTTKKMGEEFDSRAFPVGEKKWSYCTTTRIGRPGLSLLTPSSPATRLLTHGVNGKQRGAGYKKKHFGPSRRASLL